MNKTISLYVAMILAGIAGYFVLWFSVRRLDPLDYTIFATFWSALYFLVGSLAGLQQEVTRASFSASEFPTGNREAHRGAAWKLATYLVGGLILLGTIIELFFQFTGTNFSTNIFTRATAPIVLALAGYVLVAIIAGSLYGLRQWALLAWMIVGDAVLRLGFIYWTLNTSADIDILLWDVSVPFGLTIVLLAPFLLRALKGKVVTDVKAKYLFTNSLQTIFAAVGMSLIISGFPLLLASTSQQVSAIQLSQAMFFITLARAPFVIVAISLQSLLLVKFKEQLSPSKLIAKIAFGLLCGGIVLVPIVLFLSEPVLELLIADSAALSPVLLTSVVISGLLLALLVITGVAVLAKSQHLRYAAGWSVAAFLTILILVIPCEFELRVMLALLLPPVAGIVVHVLGLQKPKQ